MAIHLAGKASHGVVKLAAALTTAATALAGGWFTISPPPPPPPQAPQTSEVQLTQAAGGQIQLTGLHFEPNEPIEIFVLPAPEAPTSQYTPWLQVLADPAGAFVQPLNLNVPANEARLLYVSARGKRGFVAPVGPLQLHTVAPIQATATGVAHAPLLLTVVPPQPIAPQPSPTPKLVIKEPVGLFYVEYFNSRDLEGAPVIARNESAIEGRWGFGAPEGVRADNFSARYVGKFNFAGTENFEFTMVAAGGVRLYVDDVIVLNDWRAAGRRTITVDVPLLQGEHVVKLDYFASTGAAQLGLSWAVNYSRWEGRYYNTNDWTGPVIRKCDDGDGNGFLNMDWAEGAPVPGVNPDNFSVMWERRAFFEAGDYKFLLDLDDGAKIYIDDIEMFNDLHAVGPHEFTRKLSRGTHKLQVLYAEYGGGAKMKLNWTMLTPAPAAVP